MKWPELLTAILFCYIYSIGPLFAQTPTGSQRLLKDYSNAPSWFPNIVRPYRQNLVSSIPTDNSPRLRSLIHNGKLELSVADALALAIENNLDISVQRFVVPMSQSDVLRTEAGSAARGFSGATIPLGLSAGALGAGVSTTVAGGGVGSAGGITGGGGAVTIAPVGTFDPTINYNFSWDRTSSPLNTLVVAGVPLVSSYSTSYAGSYTQLMQEGTSYFVSLNGLRSSSTQRGLLFDPGVTTRMVMGFNHPLLSGFGFKPNQRFLLVARNNQRLSKEVLRQQVSTVIVQVESAYWDLAQFQENVKVAEQSLAVSQRLLEDNRKEVAVGALAPLDILSAQAEVASRERDLVVAKTNLELQQTQLKHILSRQFDPEVEAAELVTTDLLPEPRDADIPKFEEALADAFNNRSDLHIAEVNVQNEGITTAYTRNNLLPGANIFSQYAGAGLAGNGLNVAGGLSNSLTQTIEGAYPEYSGGMSVVLPLRNRAAFADNLRAQLETQQSQVILQRLRNQASLAVRQGIIGLVQGKAQVQAAHEAARLAQETLDAEQRKLAAGVSTSYNVILRERDLTTAQYAEVQAVDGYAKAVVAMDQARGGMAERNGIKFDDSLSGTITQTPTPHFNVRGYSVGGQ